MHACRSVSIDTTHALCRTPLAAPHRQHTVLTTHQATHNKVSNTRCCACQCHNRTCKVEFLQVWPLLAGVGQCRGTCRSHIVVCLVTYHVSRNALSHGPTQQPETYCTGSQLAVLSNSSMPQPVQWHLHRPQSCLCVGHLSDVLLSKVSPPATTPQSITQRYLASSHVSTLGNAAMPRPVRWHLPFPYCCLCHVHQRPREAGDGEPISVVHLQLKSTCCRSGQHLHAPANAAAPASPTLLSVAQTYTAIVQG